MSEQNSWNGKSVLIVDDSPRVRAELKRIYTSIGMTISGTAENGVEALLAITKEKPDLVSLDIIMPEMDGIECYRKIQQVDPTVRCVFISCLGGDPKVLECLGESIPVKLFQGKPVDETILRERLIKVFNDKYVSPKPTTAEDQEEEEEEVSPDILDDPEFLAS